jgi:hypothetical protein
LGRRCRNVVTVTPFRQYPIGLPEAEPQGNAMISVRITAAGAVAVASLAFLTAPVSACDERFIKKCERASAGAAAAAEAQDSAPVARRKSVKRVQVVASRGARHARFVKRTRAPGFANRAAGMTLASGSSRSATLPESALSRRFRGFIDPRPLAQNAFETWRKPHLAAFNLEPPESAPVVENAEAAPAPMRAETAPPPASIVTTAKQDRIAPKPAAMELAAAETRPVVLPELPRYGAPIAASMVPTPAIQAVLSEASSAPADPQPSRFGFHQLFFALCGALGAASALRFIVGA